MEAILQGWLTKSPPENKQFKLFGSKWRKRYFVLYAPPTVDGIPDARTAILEYYSSKKLHNKCGTINLSDCEEVLSSLDSEMFQNVFGLRTMHKNHLRTYYLAAATEVEMNKWVNRLCQVLGLTENDDGLSPQPHLPLRPGQPLRSLHMTTQPMGIPGSTRQTFQPTPRPLTHQTHQPHFGQSSGGGLLSPAPPPMRPVPSTPAAPFSRLNISEPNLLDAAKGGYPDNRWDVADDGLRIASPPGPSRLASPPGAPSSLKSAGSFPELDRFSPTTRKPMPGEGREFMELPPIPPEKTGPKVPVTTVEPVRDADYDLPKQKYYERSDGEEKETKNKSADDSWYNSPPSRYNKPPSDNSFYNSPPSRYNNTQPPKSDVYNVPPREQYKSTGGDSGLGASNERIREDGHEWYNVPQTTSEEGAPHVPAKHHEMRDPTDACLNVPPLKPKRFTQQDDDCYNVPRSSANWSDRQAGVANWNQGQVNGGANWNEQQVSNWWNCPQNLRQDSEDCYNVPKSQQDKRKHVSQGEEFYNIPKSQGPGTSSNLPRQKSDRRSYGGRGFDQDQSSCYRSSYDPSEDYDMPKRIIPSRPESGHGDLGLYNIPGLSMSSTATDNDFYNRPQSGWGKTEERQMPFNGDRPSQVQPHRQGLNEGARDGPEGHKQVATGLHDRVDYGSNPYNVPPTVSSAASSSGRHLHESDVSKQPMFPASHPSLDQQNLINVDQKTELPASSVASDSKFLSVTDDKLQSQGRVEVEGETGKSTELKKTPSGAFKQNKAVQSSTSLHKKQGLPGLPLHDSIRFTQRTKSFKRSIPSQDRSTLPLPVKRIVERSESSSSSSSDNESDQNNSTHSAKHS